MEVVVVVVVMVLIAVVEQQVGLVEGVWCVARSGARDDALQSGLDYACAGGADCGPIQQTGLCFLPNTLQAHASYAFNSFYQRNHMSASSCDFGGAATLAKTDPSYGSCVYPGSPSTAGSITSGSGGGTRNPYGTSTTFGGGASSMGPPISTTNSDSNSTAASLPTLLLSNIFLVILLLLSIPVC